MEQLVIGLLGGGAFTSIVVAILQRRKTAADVNKTDADTELIRLALTAQIREIYGGTIADLTERLAHQRGEFEAEVANLKKQRQDDRAEANAETTRLRVEHEKCLSNLARVEATLDTLSGTSQVTRLADKVGMLEARIMEMTADE